MYALAIHSFSPERREQRGVTVHDARRQLLHQPRTEDPQESSKAHEFDSVLFDECQQAAFKCALIRERSVIHELGVHLGALRKLECARTRHVAHDEDDLGGDRPLTARIEDRSQGGPTP